MLHITSTTLKIVNTMDIRNLDGLVLVFSNSTKILSEFDVGGVDNHFSCILLDYDYEIYFV